MSPASYHSATKPRCRLTWTARSAAAASANSPWWTPIVHRLWTRHPRPPTDRHRRWRLLFNRLGTGDIWNADSTESLRWWWCLIQWLCTHQLRPVGSVQLLLLHWRLSQSSAQRLLGPALELLQFTLLLLLGQPEPLLDRVFLGHFLGSTTFIQLSCTQDTVVIKQSSRLH